MDLSKLSTEDLLALQAGDLTKVSTQGLESLRAAQAEPQAPAEPDSVGRQVGLTARYGAKALATIPAMMADAVTGPVNALADALAGKGRGYRFKQQMPELDRMLTSLGLPEPRNATERVVGDATTAMAGAGGTAKLADYVSRRAAPVVSAVAERLAAAPGMQILSGATGTGAGSIARENDVGAGGQLLATLAGGAIPGVALAGGSEGLRRLLRGGEAGRQKTADNLRLFQEAGTTPSVGQATESRVARGIESLLSKTPGGAGVMARKAEGQADELGAAVDQMASKLAPRATAESAGRTIREGVKGEGGFLQRFRKEQEGLYDKLDEFIDKQSPVKVSRTQAALAELNADIPNAPELSKWFKNAKIQGIERAMGADVDANAGRAYTPSQLKAAAAKADSAQGLNEVLNEGALPYESIKKLRTLVGKELDNPSLMADVPRSKWVALYSALSEDLGDTAKGLGKPAQQAWERANTYTRSGIKRIEALDPVVSKADPEDIFSAAVSGTREGASRIRAVMQSLKPEEQAAIAATTLRRMGLATPGKQNELGDAFSSETFLTNWNRLSPEAKQAIFGRKAAQEIADRLKAVVGVASNVRDGSKVFANPSGTAQALTLRETGIGALVAALSGQPLAAAGLAAVPAGAYGLGRRMVNRDFANWLAKPTEFSRGIAPGELNALSQLLAGAQQ